MRRQFVSYPKSGRTWIRYILAQLDVDQQIQFHHDRFEFNDGARPAHDFDVVGRLREYSNVEKLVYLERDPRDVMVSLYYQVTGRFMDFFGYEGSISEFIRDDYFGAGNLERFRRMWTKISARLGFLTVSYEECHRDTAGTLRKLLAYYAIDVDSARLSEAVANSEFDKMNHLEQSETFEHPWLRPRNSAPKVRQGKVGGFRDALGEEDIEFLNDVFT
jgi:hypothetical protein